MPRRDEPVAPPSAAAGCQARGPAPGTTDEGVRPTARKTPLPYNRRMDYAALFAEIRTVAVVGYSDNPKRAGHFVAHYLKDAGYSVLAVNPRFGDEVDGLPCYPNVGAIPADLAVDVIDVFRTPSEVPRLVDEVLGMLTRPKYFWMQPGAVSAEAARKCEEHGIVPILGDCMLAEHKRLSR